MYEPDNRPIYAISNLSNRSDSRDRCLHPDWLNQDTAEEYFRGELFAARSDRVLLRLPMGSTKPDSFGERCASAQGPCATEPWRWEILVRVCREWLSGNPLRTLELYMASCQRTPYKLVATDEYHDLEPLDLTSVRWFNQTVVPWIVEIGVSRIVLDASSLDERYLGAWGMSYRVQCDWGVTLSMEAVRLETRGGRIIGIDRATWDDMPYFCASQYVINRDNFAAKYAVPDGYEGVIVCTGHTPDLTAERLDGWRNMGWSVGSMHRSHDDLVFGE